MLAVHKLNSVKPNITSWSLDSLGEVMPGAPQFHRAEKTQIARLSGPVQVHAIDSDTRHPLQTLLGLSSLKKVIMNTEVTLFLKNT